MLVRQPPKTGPHAGNYSGLYISDPTLTIVSMLTAKTGPYTGSYSGLYILHPVLTVVGTALPKQDLIQESTQAVHT